VKKGRFWFFHRKTPVSTGGRKEKEKGTTTTMKYHQRKKEGFFLLDQYTKRSRKKASCKNVGCFAMQAHGFVISYLSKNNNTTSS